MRVQYLDAVLEREMKHEGDWVGDKLHGVRLPRDSALTPQPYSLQRTCTIFDSQSSAITLRHKLA